METFSFSVILKVPGKQGKIKHKAYRQEEVPLALSADAMSLHLKNSKRLG